MTTPDQTQKTFPEAIQAAIDIRRKYTERIQEHYEQHQRDLSAIGNKLKRAKKRQSNLQIIQLNYQHMLDLEKVFGGRLNPLENLLPEDCRKKLEAIYAEIRRTRYFGDRGFVYSAGERGLIGAYIQNCGNQIATRKMTQSQYEFLMSKSPRSIVKQFLR